MKLDNLSTRVSRRMRSESARMRWQWLRYWRPNTQSGRLMAMFEAVLLPVLVLWLGWKLRPDDPLGAHAGFP